MTYQVKNRFQNVPFKRKLQRYSADGKGWLHSRVSDSDCSLVMLVAVRLVQLVSRLGAIAPVCPPLHMDILLAGCHKLDVFRLLQNKRGEEWYSCATLHVGRGGVHRAGELQARVGLSTPLQGGRLVTWTYCLSSTGVFVVTPGWCQLVTWTITAVIN